MGKGFFITGTDTGVGKTFVAATIARALKKRSVCVGVMKPVETGCVRHGAELFAKDAARLIEASGTDTPLDIVNPYRFSAPLAPWLAARMEGGEEGVDVERIRSLYETISGAHDVVLVEGAGGLGVPISTGLTMADLAGLLKTPLIVVAPSKLGTINHTVLTVSYARSLGLEVRGIVLNHPHRRTDESSATNLEAISQLTGVPIIGEISFAGNDPFEKTGIEQAGVEIDLDVLIKGRSG